VVREWLLDAAAKDPAITAVEARLAS